MADNTTIGQKFFAAISIAAIFIFMVSGSLFAKIPEPDNIIYGIAGDGVATVTLEVNGQQVASYSMGENPDAGEFYILRVPIDSLDPQEPDSARPGDEADIFINYGTAPVVTVTIGERGTIQKVHLMSDDADGDGLPDAEEDYLGTNPHNSDTDGDSLSDDAELNTHGTDPLLADTDGDGYSDGHEIIAGTNPRNENELPVIYVDAGSTSGTELGTAENPFLTITGGVIGSQEKYVVLVAPGTYEESVIIDKDIRLIGESPSTTIIDANDLTAVDCTYTPAGDEMAGIERFTIRNADIGIMCGPGTSPVIRNNIITRIADFGIFCDALSSSPRIINNTIAVNTGATAIKSYSSAISIINNIISDNYAGIDCEGAELRIDYNNLWNHMTVNYVGLTLSGSHDISTYPYFVSENDFHLRSLSLCIDAGDPVETLTGDYTAGNILTVDEATNLEIGNRIWITDGLNLETDLITGLASTSVEIPGGFMNSYQVVDGSFMFTDTSDASNEPDTGIFRIDMGAYGNTDGAGATSVYCDGNFDIDGDVDGLDLAELVSRPDILDLLPGFASNFGRTDCSE